MVYLGGGEIAGQGEKTVPTGTAEAIGTGEANSVIVKALAANTVDVYVGGSGVTTSNGFPLAAGEAIALDVRAIGDIFVISGSASQKVRYLATRNV